MWHAHPKCVQFDATTKCVRFDATTKCVRCLLRLRKNANEACVTTRRRSFVWNGFVGFSAMFLLLSVSLSVAFCTVAFLFFSLSVANFVLFYSVVILSGPSLSLQFSVTLFFWVCFCLSVCLLLPRFIGLTVHFWAQATTYRPPKPNVFFLLHKWSLYDRVALWKQHQSSSYRQTARTLTYLASLVTYNKMWLSKVFDIFLIQKFVYHSKVLLVKFL